MIEFIEARISSMIIHKVGNQSKDEGMVISNALYPLDDELETILKKYFFKSFKNVEDSYKFKHLSDLQMNEVFSYCSDIFGDENTLYLRSINILKHLYEQSSHPHIKSGELYVVHFEDVILEGELMNAIGIFKSEQKDTFLKFKQQLDGITVNPEQGIDIKKLDKGCLVFDTEKDSGYRVFSVDNNNYDAQYWKEDFLTIEVDQNENFLTKNYLDMCREFSNDVVAKQEDRKEQVVFLNKSVDYFAKQDTFDLEEFTQEVIPNEEYAEEFKNYKELFEEKHEIDTPEQFEISQPAVKTAKRKIKSVINLDTNIQIKLNFNDQDSGNKFIEKGYDSDKEMYFYTVYFNKETN